MLRNALPLVCLFAAGCAGFDQPIRADPRFGDAVRANMAAHIIDPRAPDPGIALPGDGQRRVLAVERYRLDEVESPATTAISTVGPSGVAEED